eukprot:3888794-Amphidinium_carterae.1
MNTLSIKKVICIGHLQTKFSMTSIGQQFTPVGLCSSILLETRNDMNQQKLETAKVDGHAY